MNVAEVFQRRSRFQGGNDRLWRQALVVVEEVGPSLARVVRAEVDDLAAPV